MSATNGSMSPDSPEQRVFLSIPDWSQVPFNALAQVNFIAAAPNQSDLVVPVMVQAQNTKQQVPSNFTGAVLLPFISRYSSHLVNRICRKHGSGII